MPKTVLLADDSITIQRVVELTFAGQDVKVVSVGDGDQAIETMTRDVPDLVLADIGMPGRTGYQVAEFMRSQPRFSSVPVLLLAGAFESADHEQAHQVGADGILTKPFDPAVLVARVKELLTAGRGAPSSVQSHPPSTRLTDLLPRVTPSAAPVAPADGPEALSSEQLSIPAAAAPAAGKDGERPVDAPAAQSSSDTDRYFEQVDQAFAALSRTPRQPLPPARDEAPPDIVEPTSVPASAAAAAPATAPSIPLTDAFAALLDAERTGIPPPVRMTLSPAAPPPQIDADALADRIARQVLAQLSDRVVRETVSRIVGEVAERLVREEIERIKRNIK